MLFAKKIKEARINMNLTLEELADIVGTTKQTIFKYEKSVITPAPSQLEKLALALNSELSFFFSREDGLELKGVIFRNGEEEAAVRLSKIEDELIKEMLTLFELENLVKDKPEFKNPLSSMEITKMSDVEKAAEKLREEWKLGLTAISSVVEVLEQRGITVLEKFSHYSFDGFSAFFQERPLIVLNTRVIEITRRRFTALHELGHILLSKIVSKKMKDRIEEICDAFAGALLLPLEVLKEFWKERKSFFMQDFINLKESFGISIMAIWIRAIHKDYLSWETYHKWKEAYKSENSFGTFVGFENPKRPEKLLLKCVTMKKLPVSTIVEKAKIFGNNLDKQIRINMNYNLVT